MWRVEGPGGRWAEMAGEGFRADARTLGGVRAHRGDTLPLTPTGPSYAPTGDDDEVWLWLAANRSIDGRAQLVAGTAPQMPIPAPIEGATY